MRKPFNPLPVGQSLLNASLPGIEQINGIIVDNPSGQWLFILPLYDYVPPYTMGWSRNLSGGVTQINVTPGNGPAGQVSTLQGDPVIISLDSETVGVSQGATTSDSFIDQFTPTIARQSSEYIPVSGFNFGILAPVVGKRYRVWSFAAAIQPDRGMDSGLSWNLLNWDGGAVFSLGSLGGYVSPMMPFNGPFVFPNGLDFDINVGVGMTALSTWADAYLSYSMTYQLI